MQYVIAVSVAEQIPFHPETALLSETAFKSLSECRFISVSLRVKRKCVKPFTIGGYLGSTERFCLTSPLLTVIKVASVAYSPPASRPEDSAPPVSPASGQGTRGQGAPVKPLVPIAAAPTSGYRSALRTLRLKGGVTRTAGRR